VLNSLLKFNRRKREIIEDCARRRHQDVRDSRHLGFGTFRIQDVRNARRLGIKTFGVQDVGDQDVGNEDVRNQDVGNQDIGSQDIGNQDKIQTVSSSSSWDTLDENQDERLSSELLAKLNKNTAKNDVGGERSMEDSMELKKQFCTYIYIKDLTNRILTEATYNIFYSPSIANGRHPTRQILFQILFVV